MPAVDQMTLFWIPTVIYERLTLTYLSIPTGIGRFINCLLLT